MSSEDRIREEQIKKQLIKINAIENQINQPHYNLNQEQKFSVHITVDNTIKHGLFQPDPKREGAWLASEQTFRAMKKDIFALGESVDELVEPYQCHSCKTDLDMQFWHFCPYCGSSFLI